MKILSAKKHKLFISPIFLLIILSFFSTTLWAVADPTQLGAYKIGHTTMVITDPTRNRDGSVGTQGRPLYLHIWYPSNSLSGPLVQYPVNNPIYDGTHTGYPLIDVPMSFASGNNAREGAPISNDSFPLLIFSHGSTGSATLGFPPLMETLASHGYIVVAVEHTGNNWIRATGLSLNPPVASPGMGAGVTRMIRRSQDVRFVIDKMLDQSVNPLRSYIDEDAIGLFGYSLGGGTTMLTVAGLAPAGMLPDPRIKAAIPMDGTDSVGFSPNDYANVHVPLMLYQDGPGVNPNALNNPYIFPQLVNSTPKYFADVSSADHVGAGYPNMCSDLRDYLVALEATPLQPGLLATARNTLTFQPSFFEYCNASLFQGISTQTLTDLGVDVAEIQAMMPLMPLRKATPASEFYRMMKWYVVSFFNKELKHQNEYALYLEDSKDNRKINPLIEFSKNCRFSPDRLMDLKPGDKITFKPVDGKGFNITFSKGNALLDKGTNNLNLGDDAQAVVTLPFSFSMPNTAPSNKINVYSNGTISISNLVNSDGFSAGFEYSAASPWMMRGELLLNGQPTIAPLLQDLDPSQGGGGVFAKVESNRVIVTWDAVPICCSGLNPSTMQVVINKNGTIEMIYGVMTTVGPEYDPNDIGTIGIATGKSGAKEVRSGYVDFSTITQSIKLPSAVETFYVGTGGQCN